MNKNINDYIDVYKQALSDGEIQVAYEFLVKYVMEIKSAFSQKYGSIYKTGNVSPGYLDFTYFPFHNDMLRAKKLRFGIVLNHNQMRFELWLMGQNTEIQKEYWNELKISKWNIAKTEMPKYSVLEAVLIETPDFNKIDELTGSIIEKAGILTKEVVEYLTKLNK